MFDLWRARPARKAATHVIASFMRPQPEGSAIPGSAWLQPHVLGFLSMLVTLIALRESGRLRSHALAHVQSSVIDELSGVGSDLIGEEICLLSSREDAAFAAGCAGARSFYEALLGVPREGLPWPDGDAEAGGQASRRALEEIWQEHVASRLPPPRRLD